MNSVQKSLVFELHASHRFVSINSIELCIINVEDKSQRRYQRKNRIANDFKQWKKGSKGSLFSPTILIATISNESST